MDGHVPLPGKPLSSLVDAEVLVHIGLPKTATTWLQHHLFGQAAMGFWGPARDAPDSKQQVKALGRRFYSDDRGRLIADDDFDAEALRRTFADIEVPAGVVPVISNERLSGHPLSNAFDRASLCRRLNRVLPRARILMVLREQNSMILSSYMQYLKYGGWHDLDRFMSPPGDHRMPGLDLQVWRYDRLIRLYHEEFGKQRVLALPYEMFVSEPTVFLGRIAAFAGTTAPHEPPVGKHENLRRRHVAAYYLRRLNSMARPSSANAFAAGPAARLLGRMAGGALRLALAGLVPAALDDRLRIAFDEQIARATGDYFAASNRVASQLSGIDLASFGYRT